MKLRQDSMPEAELNALYDVFHKQPIQKDKIVFNNFHGNGYGCNPKYIAEALLSSGQKRDIVWLTNGNVELPDGIRAVPYHTVEAIKEIATAQVLVDNVMKFNGFKKRPDQYYIQTWHGDLPLKKIGFDNPANAGAMGYAKRVKVNFGNTDLVTVNSRFVSELFRRTFEYQGEILLQGLPRNEILFQIPDSLREVICDYFNISMEKKIILYAPTYRDAGDMNPFTMDYQQVLDQLGDEYVMLIRLHPRMKKYAESLVYTDRIINASSYPDMQELMAVSDIMITDYSCVMFSFALTRRPVYLFASDVEEYRKQRDYYFDIYDLPFPLASTTDELIRFMLSKDRRNYQEKLDQFWERIGMHDEGNAAGYVAKWILERSEDKNVTLKNSDLTFMDNRIRVILLRARIKKLIQKRMTSYKNYVRKVKRWIENHATKA